VKKEAAAVFREAVKWVHEFGQCLRDLKDSKPPPQKKFLKSGSKKISSGGPESDLKNHQQTTFSNSLL
jgi:hypothetical protein